MENEMVWLPNTISPVLIKLFYLLFYLCSEGDKTKMLKVISPSFVYSPNAITRFARFFFNLCIISQ